MGELKYRADSLVNRLNQTIQILSDQRDKLRSWEGDLRSLAESAEKTEEENKKLFEENKRLQAELAKAKK